MSPSGSQGSSPRPLARLSRVWGLVASHPSAWLGARLILEAQKRSGQEARAYPARPWRQDEWRDWVADAWRNAAPSALVAVWRGGSGAAWGRSRRTAAFRAAHAAGLGTAGRASLLAAAEGILAGRFTLFSHHVVEAGFPPPWQANPLMGGAVPPGAPHWSRIPMSDPGSYGDLKLVWELSRAAWAFTLARAYVASGDDRFAEGFWRLWMDWIEANPPHATVQWKCGQECSLRLIAVTFAVEVLADAAATTPERFARHLGAVGALADRVHRGGWYAQLQDNNHSMSEGAGAYTTGVAYPVLRDAGRWRADGWQRLCREAERLIRSDGTFRQKSHNYHRLMLHVYLWAASLAEIPGDRFPAAVHARLAAAADYLTAVVDVDSGEAPNFGPNDGALILPLAEAPYSDFRPTVAAAAHLASDRRRDRVGDGVGPAAELSLWLFGPKPMDAPVMDAGPAPARDLALAEGGIYTLHQAQSWVFTHAERFHDRPAQADQLHVDLWWRGLNLARDPGTYLYYGPARLNDWFRGTSCHNTVAVDGRDQMEPGPRFLWASRAQARAEVERGPGGEARSLWMTHDGYQRLSPPVTHERRVTALGGDTWLVVDDLTSRAGVHRYRLHWLLPDYPTHPEHGGCWRLETPLGIPYYVKVVAERTSSAISFVYRAIDDPVSPWGWESRHYAERVPARSLVLETSGIRERFITLFSPRRPEDGANPEAPPGGGTT